MARPCLRFGALTRRPNSADVAEALGLTCAVDSYYAYIEVLQGGAGRIHLPSTAAFWLIAGSSAGAMFGFAGQQWGWERQRSRVASVVVLAGALLGEGLVVLIRQAGPVSWIVVAVEFTAGILAPIILLRKRALRMSFTATGIVAATITGAIATASSSYLAGRLG